jgi:hypothetical protein
MESWIDRLPDLRGPVYTKDAPGYGDEVSVFNQAVQHQPAIVVGAADAADVSKAVTFASEHGFNIAILNTGHGPAVPADGETVMITTKRMCGLVIDVRARSARIEAGVRFGQLVKAAAECGLAPLPGSSPGVGVVGYTLSGGASSTMGRKYGWAADHVTAIELVTAEGRLRRVSAQCAPELFGALLGGKSNFGVVTAMEFGLFPVTSLYAGALFYSGEHSRQVLEAYRLLTATAPDELTTSFVLLNLPPLPGLPPFMQGRLTASVRISFVGDPATGARLIEPLRRAAPPLSDNVTEIPYTQFGSISNDPTDPAPAVEQFGLLRELTQETVKAIIDVTGPESGSAINIVDIRHLQGAFARPAPYPNAVGARDAAFAVVALTVVPPWEKVVHYRQSGCELIAALQPWLHHKASPCFQGPSDATEERTRLAYEPEIYNELRAVKATYDPQNRFRFNHNIPPSAAP